MPLLLRTQVRGQAPAGRQMGGLRHPPSVCLRYFATAITTSSRHMRPTTCTPIGYPSFERPEGTTTQGWPESENGSV